MAERGLSSSQRFSAPGSRSPRLPAPHPYRALRRAKTRSEFRSGCRSVFVGWWRLVPLPSAVPEVGMDGPGRVPHRIVPYHIVPYRTVSYRIVSFNVYRYCTVLYCTVPYRIVPYHTVPYLVTCRRAGRVSGIRGLILNAPARREVG